MTEDKLLRRRQTEINEDLAQRREGFVAGNPTKLVKTVTIGTYPVVAQAYYMVQALRPGGNQTEGAAVTTTVVGAAFPAANIGTQIPPTGTIGILVTFTGGRWCFKYDG